MTDPRASTALRHLPLDPPSPDRPTWAVVTPDPAGRIRLPAAVLDLLGTGAVGARIVGGVLVLGDQDGAGRRIGVDRRGRLYLPASLRVAGVVLVADPGTGVVVVADVAVLDAVGERLLQAARP